MLVLAVMDIPGTSVGNPSFLGLMGAATTDRGAQMVEDLLQLGIAISSEGELAPVLERIVTQARRFTGAEAATLFLREGAHLRFAVVQNEIKNRRVGDYEMQQRLEVERLPLDVPSLAGYVANSGEVVNVREAYEIPSDAPYSFNWRVDLATGYRTHSVLAVPLRDAAQRNLGVLQLINAIDLDGQAVPFHPRLEDVARAFAAYAAIAVRSARLEELSFKDPLTDGYNRRYLMLRLYEEVSRAARYQQPFSLILLDLDGFKAVNDRWGHGAGDDVLKQVVQLLASQSRRDSVVARYGGDEFIALLPSTTKAAALVYAERMRGIIERYPFQHGPLTASFGVAGYPDDPGNVADLIKRADHALYEAKRQGRNLVGGL
ncbi:MAG TPA: sensor domain-containing diguanylate cyclase [Methylomirabilota bacterium]|nr:sensor domain-containing diguanylate cyclase [Methylomirabilota bacterium]